MRGKIGFTPHICKGIMSRAAQAATMFLCGDDVEAKTMVTQLGEDLGFEMLAPGPLTIARLLEPLAMLWIHLAVFQGLGPDIAFALQRR